MNRDPELIAADVAPMDVFEMQRLMRSGKYPVTFVRQPHEINYDIKFYWRNPGKGFSSGGYRIFFGNYFRDPNLNATSMTIGPGKPYKTDSVVMLLDPPSAEHRYSILPYTEQTQHSKGRKGLIPGTLASKSLMNLLFEAAKDSGIKMSAPQQPGEILSIKCKATPLIKDKVENKKILVLNIFEIDRK